MAIEKLRESVTVKLGVLSQSEFDGLTPAEQTEVEIEAVRLAAKYGRQFFVKHRDRLRSELNLIYGI